MVFSSCQSLVLWLPTIAFHRSRTEFGARLFLLFRKEESYCQAFVIEKMVLILMTIIILSNNYGEFCDVENELLMDLNMVLNSQEFMKPLFSFPCGILVSTCFFNHPCRRLIL